MKKYVNILVDDYVRFTSIKLRNKDSLFKLCTLLAYVTNKKIRLSNTIYNYNIDVEPFAELLPNEKIINYGKK